MDGNFMKLFVVASVIRYGKYITKYSERYNFDNSAREFFLILCNVFYYYTYIKIK